MIFIQPFFHGKIFHDLKQYRKLQLTMFPIHYGSVYMRIKMGGFYTSSLGKGDFITHSGSKGSFTFFIPAKI